jgi:hypothetical protein
MKKHQVPDHVLVRLRLVSHGQYLLTNFRIPTTVRREGVTRCRPTNLGRRLAILLY